ncbi:MAG: mechanosensitive ion channel domain-containing protein [Thermoanaerobaculia bacterium]
MQDLEARRPTLSVVILALLACVATTPLVAQVDAPPTTPVPSLVVQPTPIPDVEISARAAAARDQVREAESIVAPDERFRQIQEAFPVEQQRIVAVRGNTEELLQTSASTSLIREAEKAALRIRDRLDRWIRDLVQRSSIRESTLKDLQDTTLLWELTRDVEREEELPEALQQQISEVLEVLGASEGNVRSARDAVLALQVSVAQEQGALDELLARQREEISRRNTAIFAVDSPPLWKASRTADEEDGVVDQLVALAKRQWQDLREYVTDEGAPLFTWLFLWLGLAGVLIFYRHRVKGWAQEDPSLGTTVTLLDRPLAAAAVLILVLTNIIEVQAPTAWLDVLDLLLLLTLVFLLLGVLTQAIRPVLYLLIPFYFLFQVVSLAPMASPTQRLSMVALSVVGVLLCLWSLRLLHDGPRQISAAWRRVLVHGLRLATLLLAVGLIVNVLGRARFGAMLVVGTADAILTGIVFWVVAALLRSMVRVALLTKTAHRVGIAPEHSDTVRERLFHVITLATTIFWGIFALRGFTLYEPVAAKVLSALRAKLSIGEFSVSLGSLLLFVFIIWFSTKLAALVEFVLGELILPRLHLPQGAPHAISRVSRYTIIVIGVLVATKALGLDISQAAIVAGGLGVGIGFGLQNVVSNFVSGLILLFERPIRVGDIVQVGTASGTVEKIGMRATVVSTWRGSELIVPNTKLIASDVDNWTLQHDRRRIEIPIGVAYGTDPEVVAKLLVDTATCHPEVDEHPEPQCLFMEFGDSSLNFELRAWGAASRGLGIESDLRFAITKALEEAGITIPFPQRDLHLRSTVAEIPAAESKEEGP